jgi:hypothetical protein
MHIPQPDGSPILPYHNPNNYRLPRRTLAPLRRRCFLSCGYGACKHDSARAERSRRRVLRDIQV